MPAFAPGFDPDDLHLIARTRLNGLDAFYRGTLMGAGQLALVQHDASTPDLQGIDPKIRRRRDRGGCD